MQDIEVTLENKPGELARLGQVLGAAGISLEGGGVFSNGETAMAHFLVADGNAARRALANEGILVTHIYPVLIVKLRQDVPGQLGLFCGELAKAGVNILVQYSDHNNQLVVVADDYNKGKLISDKWMNDWW